MGTLITKCYEDYDKDAADYINRVETADGQRLEETTRRSFNSFVVGCKADGIWNAIKASCILAGARTLGGCLTPLKGTAPTNYNFTNNRYNRKTGLHGALTTFYLDSNRKNNDDPQDNNHNAAYITVAGAGTRDVMSDGSINRMRGSLVANRNTDGESVPGAAPNFLYGTSRNNSSSFVCRNNGSNITINRASQDPGANNLLVFSRFIDDGFYNGRISFYSIGEAIDLELLENHISQLMSDIDNAF